MGTATVGTGPPSRTRPPARTRLDRRQLVQARELTANLVRRDLTVRHRGTFLGMLWSLANPLLVVGLFYLIFKFIVRTSPAADVARPDHHAVPFAVYFFCGLTLWNLFANAAQNGTGSVVGSGYLLRKVYFPRQILPLSSVLSSLVTFGFEVVVLLAVVVVAVGAPDAHILWAPAIVAIVAVLAYGAALFLSAVTVFLRDVAHFIGLVIQVGFWGTPVLYSLQYVRDHPGVVRLLELNPMTGAVVSFRNVVLLNQPPDLPLLGYDLAVALVALAVGGWAFRRWERLFPEIV